MYELVCSSPFWVKGLGLSGNTCLECATTQSHENKGPRSQQANESDAACMTAVSNTVIVCEWWGGVAQKRRWLAVAGSTYEYVSV
jgi:hypothetical protein